MSGSQDEALAIDVQALLAAWPLSGPWRVHATRAGTNNRSYQVETPAGAYLLRVYQNTTDLARVRYEHALLVQLAQAALSFAVPAPVPSGSGATVVALPAADGTALAALFPLIPGRHPQPGNSLDTSLAGGALGELDRALAGISLDLEPVLTPCGVLENIHPLAPPLAELPGQLPLNAVQRERLADVITRVQAAIPRLYTTLPQQIIHGDLALSNVLLADDRVSGILDFEFAAPDLRTLDLAAGVAHFVGEAWGSRSAWEMIDAFAAGYLGHCPLTAPEIAALPQLLRLYRVAGLLHWTGRQRQGLAAEAVLTRRTFELLALDDWLAVHGEALVDRIAALGSGAY